MAVVAAHLNCLQYSKTQAFCQYACVIKWAKMIRKLWKSPHHYLCYYDVALNFNLSKHAAIWPSSPCKYRCVITAFECPSISCDSMSVAPFR